MPFSHNRLKSTTGIYRYTAVSVSQVNKYTLTYRFLNGNVHGCVFAKNRPVSLNWSDYNSIMRSHLLKCPHKISKQARNNKKYVYKGPYGPTILLLQDARDRYYVQMYNMLELVPSRLPRDQIECSTVEAFKNCKNVWNVDQNEK